MLSSKSGTEYKDSICSFIYHIRQGSNGSATSVVKQIQSGVSITIFSPERAEIFEYTIRTIRSSALVLEVSYSQRKKTLSLLVDRCIVDTYGMIDLNIGYTRFKQTGFFQVETGILGEARSTTFESEESILADRSFSLI